MDGDGEDSVGDGRRDEFADGEFFGVENAKGDEEGGRNQYVGARGFESLMKLGAGLTSSTWTSRSYKSNRIRSASRRLLPQLSESHLYPLAIPSNILLTLFKALKLDVRRTKLVLLTSLHDDPHRSLLSRVPR